MSFVIREVSYEPDGHKRDDVYTPAYANKADAIRMIFHWMESDQLCLLDSKTPEHAKDVIKTNAYYIIEVSDV